MSSLTTSFNLRVEYDELPSDVSHTRWSLTSRVFETSNSILIEIEKDIKFPQR